MLTQETYDAATISAPAGGAVLRADQIARSNTRACPASESGGHSRDAMSPAGLTGIHLRNQRIRKSAIREISQEQGDPMPTYLSPGVYVEEVAGGSRPIEGVGTSVAAFVGLSPTGPLNDPVLVTNWAQYVSSFGDFTDGYYLAHSVYGFFTNGGSAAYIVRVGGTGPDTETSIIGTASGRRTVTAGAPVEFGTFRAAALARSDANGGQLTLEVSDTAGEGPEERFTLTIKDGDRVAESFDVSARKGARNYVVPLIRQRSTLIQVEEAAPAGQLARPGNQAVQLPIPTGPADVVKAGTTITPAEFLGDAAERTGFGGLEALDAVNVIAVPDLMGAYQRGELDLDAVKAVQLGLIAHCERMGDRMAMIDPPPALNARQIREWRQETAGFDSSHAALYYPWISVFDPASGQKQNVPPSGHMAGVWARNDTERGVHKAPANEVSRIC
jgi:hypothetical protein